MKRCFARLSAGIGLALFIADHLSFTVLALMLIPTTTPFIIPPLSLTLLFFLSITLPLLVPPLLPSSCLPPPTLLFSASACHYHSSWSSPHHARVLQVRRLGSRLVGSSSCSLAYTTRVIMPTARLSRCYSFLTRLLRRGLPGAVSSGRVHSWSTISSSACRRLS